MTLRAVVLYAFFFAMVIFNTVEFPVQQETQMVNRDIERIDLNLQEEEAAFSFLELSSGEATLIQNNDGETVLVNTGAEEARDEIKQHMKIFNIKSIDYLFITNFSEFHTGNLKWLVDEVGVKQIVVAAGMEQKVRKMISNSTVKIVPVKEGSKIIPFPYMKFNVLYSNKVNDEGSLVLSIDYGTTKILYMGISNEELEKDLIDKHNLNAQILKVGYFGSEEGTSQTFLESVDPQVAIIFDKRNKMPSQDVMERLQAGWVDIFQPNKQGIILLKCTMDNYEVTIIPTREEQNNL